MSSELLTIPVYEHYRIIHDIYVLLDDSDRHVLNDFNLTISQYGVLNLLDADEGQRLTTLSDRLLCARSTITRIIDQLEQDGLARRIGDDEDRRAQRVVLTPEGVAQRQRVRTYHEHSLEHRLSILSTDEYQQLHRLLAKLRDGLRAQLDSEFYQGGSSTG